MGNSINSPMGSAMHPNENRMWPATSRTGSRLCGLREDLRPTAMGRPMGAFNFHEKVHGKLDASHGSCHGPFHRSWRIPRGVRWDVFRVDRIDVACDVFHEKSMPHDCHSTLRVDGS